MDKKTEMLIARYNRPKVGSIRHSDQEADHTDEIESETIEDSSLKEGPPPTTPLTGESTKAELMAKMEEATKKLGEMRKSLEKDSGLSSEEKKSEKLSNPEESSEATTQPESFGTAPVDKLKETLWQKIKRTVKGWFKKK